MYWRIIKKELDIKGWSTYRLAKESGVRESTIRSIEKGSSKNPGIQTMIKLADALDISLDEFRKE